MGCRRFAEEEQWIHFYVLLQKRKQRLSKEKAGHERRDGKGWSTKQGRKEDSRVDKVGTKW